METARFKIEKLRDKDNWYQWRFIVRTLLEEDEDLLDVCEGRLIQPKTGVAGHSDDLRRFQKADKAARKLIVTTVERKPLDLLLNCTTAREMWTKLNTVYDLKSDENLSLVQKQFFEFEWESNESVAHNVSKLEQLATKMKSLGGEIPDSMLLTRVLSTLPPKFNHFHSAWDSADDTKKSLENLTARLMSEEMRIQSQNTSEETTVALFTRTRSRGSSSKNVSYGRTGQNGFTPKGNVGCYNCGKEGHKKKDCPGCYNCGSRGHLRRNCPRRNGGSEKRDDARSMQQHTAPRQAFVGTSEAIDKDYWLIDSGASDHMTYRKDWFCSLEILEEPLTVKIGNGDTISAHGRGNIDVETLVDGNWIAGTMYNVLYIPCLDQSLFSVKFVAKKGVDFKISDSGRRCVFIRGGTVVATGSDSGSLYRMNMRVVIPRECNVVNKIDSLQLWHERLCHQNKKHVKVFLKNLGIDALDSEDVCDGCMYGKHHRMNFHGRVERATSVRDVISTDVCGPMQQESLGRKRYYVIFKDEFSGFRQIYFIREKSEVIEKLKIFCTGIENHFGRNIKELHSDGGKEYVNRMVDDFLSNRGINHTVNVPYTPQQNGVAERDNRTIVEAARSMLFSKSDLPLSLWAEAMNTAVYVINRTGPTKQSGKTPYELWHGKVANVDNLRIFGTECFVHVPNEKRKKLDKKAVKGYLVGYIENCKGYRVYVPSAGDVILSRDVVFKTEKLAPSEVSVGIEEKENSICNMPVDSPDSVLGGVSDGKEYDKEKNPLHVPTENIANTRELRNRQTIKQTEFYGCPVTFLAESLPSNYKEAITSGDNLNWKGAMQDEIESLHKNGTWVLVDKQEEKKVIGNRWVYTTKLNLDGTKRYKARLVIKGYSQKEGVDYNETFSPVVRFDTIRALLSVIARDGLHIGQFDIKTAFLYGSLSETIYMKQPEGFNDGSNKVCKLLKSLYGLKQAPRCWTEHFAIFVKHFGFKQSTADPCFYIFKEGNERLFLAVYVDDGLLAATSEYLLDSFFHELNKQFQATNTRNVTSFLGIEIFMLKNGSVFINQMKYAEKIVERFNLSSANCVYTPIDPGWDLTSSEKNCTAPYREAVGNLMFLQVVSRPDISFAVNIAARALENPSETHWLLVKRIIKYIKGTLDMGLLYRKTGVFEAYCDADFAGDKLTRKSTSGSVCMHASAAITWQSKRQQCIALSTTESEYVSAASAAKDIVWLKRLLTECDRVDESYTLYMDNMSAMKLVKNPEFHKRTKHIDVKYHFLRDLYSKGEMRIMYINTDEQTADIFTKPLAKSRFTELRSKLGLVSKNSI